MEVVLLERFEKLGQMGDVVSVKNGYARNYLLPQKKALRASKENLSIFEAQRAQLEAENLKRREEAEKVGEKLDGEATGNTSATATWKPDCAFVGSSPLHAMAPCRTCQNKQRRVL